MNKRLRICVCLDDVDKISQHFRLRALTFEIVGVVVKLRLVVGFELGKIGIHPNFNFAFLIKEDHLLGDLEDSNLFIQNFET